MVFEWNLNTTMTMKIETWHYGSLKRIKDRVATWKNNSENGVRVKFWYK